MYGTVVCLLRHRVTWRFLPLVLTALGMSALASQCGELEVALCSVLTCLD